MVKQVQPYQQLDCDIPSRQLSNVALVNKASKVKWFAQVYNTFALTGLKLTTFALRVLHFSARPLGRSLDRIHYILISFTPSMYQNQILYLVRM